jgi:hypothetical protein
MSIGSDLPWAKDGGLSTKIHEWTCRPAELWGLFFPGIEKFVEERKVSGQRLRFMHYCTSDGWSIQGLFTVEQEHRKNSLNGFNCRNYRRLINTSEPKPLQISDFTTTREAFSGANNRAFHGSGNIEHMVKNHFLRLGPGALQDALKHIWIVIDLGIINAIGGCAVTGSPVFNSAGEQDGFELKFTRFLFKTKSRYSPVRETIGRQLERAKLFQNDYDRLSGSHGRTLDIQKYEDHCKIVEEIYKPLSLSNRARKKMMDSQKLKVCNNYVCTICLYCGIATETEILFNNR